MMASTRSSGKVAGQLGSLYKLGAAGGLTDGQLLDRFLDRDDPGAAEAAFSELVDRHGSMVLGVCRRELGDTDDAHDAFQATFLVLVSKASMIRRRESVGNWLFGIARRVAAKARLEEARRRRLVERLGVERKVVDEDSPAAKPAEPERDHGPLLAEVDRLPERFRAPVVLHYLEGLSTEATAQRLGCARGTVLSRLSRARDRLRRRLEQRGVSPAPLLPIGDAPTRWLAAGPVPASLSQGTVRAASSLGLAGAAIESVVPAAVATLARKVARTLTLSRARAAALMLLVAAAGVAIGLAATLAADDAPPRGAVIGRAAGEPRKGPSPRDDQVAKADSLVLRGRVLDPDGKPVAGASMVLIVPERHTGPRSRLGRSGPGGRFEVSIPRDLLRLVGGDDAPPASIAAVAPGLGPDWAPIDLEKKAEPIVLKLRRDDVPIEGRILGRDGRPIPGLSIEVEWVADLPPERIKELRANDFRMEGFPIEFGSGTLLVAEDLGVKPPVRTGADGRFRLTGVGRDRVVILRIEGGSIEQTFSFVSTCADRDFKPIVLPGPAKSPEKIESPHFDLTVGPGRDVEGTVRDRDTGRPVADARILSISESGGGASGSSDAKGRFRLQGLPRGRESSLTVNVENQPYFAVSRRLEDPEGPEPAALDIMLKRGVWVEGRVTNASTSKPVKAKVYYYPARDNPQVKDCPEAPFLSDEAVGESLIETDRDGRFRVAALPGRGLLAVRAREPGYLTAEPLDVSVAQSYLYLMKSSHLRVSSQAILLIDVPAGKGLVVPEIRLAPGRAQHIRITDREGRPVSGAFVDSFHFQGLDGRSEPLPGDVLTYTHSRPGTTEELVFFHEGRSIGASVSLKGNEPDPVRVVLQPTGAMVGRLVDDDGRPRRDVNLRIDRSPSVAEQFKTGADGRFRIDELITGVSYSVWVVAEIEPNQPAMAVGYLNRREWTVKPGEVQDWGDVKAVNSLTASPPRNDDR